ncbi:hypothetical protein NUBL21973_52340 [Klebsiella pneumoniae]|nr:hypothetical protein NUBL21973_52340 [Klebsiella pneumoniae]GKL53164.1 hypothetical protein NUBL21992_50850 [Klebsiella pneumoniae]GKM43963.1 hypothetical protein NUBL13939_10220 [Klebsiella pneumoniae]GKN62062.1 hypothetical protein NUBL17188_47780 [Klebsiella pneumoniae]GKP41695.1 hypothetical protein NUBL515_50660 [Klebsiella pneumoniae]
MKNKKRVSIDESKDKSPKAINKLSVQFLKIKIYSVENATPRQER